MNTSTIILVIYLTGAIAAAFAIKNYNKHEIKIYNKFPPYLMLFSWIIISVISTCAISNFWKNSGRESFNKFFNY